MSDGDFRKLLESTRMIEEMGPGGEVGARVETVRDLRQALFDVQDQDGPVRIFVDGVQMVVQAVAPDESGVTAIQVVAEEDQVAAEGAPMAEPTEEPPIEPEMEATEEGTDGPR